MYDQIHGLFFLFIKKNSWFMKSRKLILNLLFSIYLNKKPSIIKKKKNKKPSIIIYSDSNYLNESFSPLLICST